MIIVILDSGLKFLIDSKLKHIFNEKLLIISYKTAKYQLIIRGVNLINII